ncbi:uncharacterized protein ACMZJ9_009925 [Mantella aurantiaca]
MTKEIKSILERALRNISDESLKSFKTKLNEIEQEIIDNIPLDKIRDRSAEELVDVIWRHYTVMNAPRIIVSLLDEINEHQASLDLQGELKRVNEMTNIETISGNGLKSVNAITNIETTSGNGLQAVNAITNIETTSGNGLQAANPSTNKVGIVQPMISSHQENERELDPPISITASSQHLTTEESPVIQEKEIATTSRKMGKRPVPRGKPLDDIKLIDLTENDFLGLKEDHNNEPHVYARLLFQRLVTFEITKKWKKIGVNFGGYGGNRSIPNNLLEKIMVEVRKEFGKLDKEAKSKIRNTLTRLVKNPSETGCTRRF